MGTLGSIVSIILEAPLAMIVIIIPISILFTSLIPIQTQELLRFRKRL